MSEHVTEVVPHDHVNCHTSHHAESGDCGTRFEARCSCGWAQGAGNRAIADAIAIGHRGYSPNAPVIVTANMTRADADRAITDEQLRELFARHCECRPLDLARSESDHAAIHDCDTGILRDVQVALGLVRFDDIGRRLQAMFEARARCAAMLLWKRNAHGGWDKPSDVNEVP
jgi:hypothetical protein